MKTHILPLFLLPLFFLQGCSPPKPKTAIQTTPSPESVALKEARTRIQNLEHDLEAKNKQLEADQDLHAQSDVLRKELAATREGFASYQNRYRQEIRFKASGETLNSLQTKDGKVYNFVVIREVDDEGLSITHQSGAAKIPFSQLDPSWSARFDYDAAEAEAKARALAEKKAAAAQAIATANPPNPTPKISDTERVNAEKELARLRQELRDELTGILGEMKARRQEHYGDTGSFGAGTYIKLKTWDPDTGENKYGGKKPRMMIDPKTDYDPQYPENSTCIDGVTTSGVFGKAKNLRTLILSLKSQTQ